MVNIIIRLCFFAYTYEKYSIVYAAQKQKVLEMGQLERTELSLDPNEIFNTLNKISVFLHNVMVGLPDKNLEVPSCITRNFNNYDLHSNLVLFRMITAYFMNNEKKKIT